MGDTTPNVLLISIDSLRADFCSFLNQSEATMPFVDTVAEEGTNFHSAISPSTWTLQSHGSLFTGLYPPEHGVVDEGETLGSHPTLSELLGRAGYRNESFARNGWLQLGDILRGFDHHHFHNVEDSVRNLLGDLTRGDIGKGITDLPATVQVGLNRARKEFLRHDPPEKRIIETVYDRLEAVNEPFCFFVHFNNVHYPYEPSYRTYRRFGDEPRRRVQELFDYQLTLRNNRAEIYRDRYDIDSEATTSIQDLYRATIYETDELIRQLVGKLEQQGLFDETVLVLFGDHGDHYGANGWYGHQFSVDDEVVRVPLVIRDPTGVLDSGAGQIAQLNDVYPTLLEILDIEYPETNSVNLTTEKRETAYVYYSAPESLVGRLSREAGVDRDELPPSRQYVAWRSPEERLTWYPDNDSFTGDLSLKSDLVNHYESLRPVPTSDERDLSQDVERNLQDMGYI